MENYFLVGTNPRKKFPFVSYKTFITVFLLQGLTLQTFAWLSYEQAAKKNILFYSSICHSSLSLNLKNT